MQLVRFLVYKIGVSTVSSEGWSQVPFWHIVGRGSLTNGARHRRIGGRLGGALAPNSTPNWRNQQKGAGEKIH